MYWSLLRMWGVLCFLTGILGPQVAFAAVSPYMSVQIEATGNGATPFCLNTLGNPQGLSVGLNVSNCIDGATSEIFLLNQLSSGLYTISPQLGPHLCLDSGGGSPGRLLVQDSCRSTATQQWKILQNANGTYSIISFDGRFAVEIQGGIARANNTPVVTGNNENDIQAQFIINGLQPVAPANLATNTGAVSPGFPVSANVVIQTAYDFSVCADIAGGSTQRNFGADIFDCEFGSPNETFAFVQNGPNGTYSIQPANGNGQLCLGSNGTSTPYGIPIIQTICHGGRAQQWIVESNADNTFSILSIDGEYAMEVQGGESSANNTPLLAWPNEGDPQARFLLSGFLTHAPPEIGNRLLNPSNTLPYAYYQDPAFNYNSYVPHGVLTSFNMSSSTSALYPGTSLCGPYVRIVYVYIPAQYVTGAPAPFTVIQDGDAYIQFPGILNLFDNLIATGAIPPMVVIFAGSGGVCTGVGVMSSQDTERNLEYDTLSTTYGNWVNGELLPAVIAASGNKVSFTANPLGRGAMGSSSGGIAAFTMAWMNPKSFSKVLSISGSYTNLEYPYNPRYPEGGWTYTTGLLGQAGSQTAPIKVWMNAGTQDLNWSAAGPYLNWTIANENMAQALSAGGYDYHFDLVLNGGHGSGPAQLETLPEALIWLWAGYH